MLRTYSHPCRFGYFKQISHRCDFLRRLLIHSCSRPDIFDQQDQLKEPNRIQAKVLNETKARIRRDVRSHQQTKNRDELLESKRTG